jgi:Stress responsive A/B Barrel Domain
MIVHVVLLKPKPEITDEQRQAIVAQLRQAATTIPSVRRLRVGKRVRHGRPGYEQMMAQDFEYALLIEFDDVEGLLAYLAHPQHAAIGMHFVQSAAAALAYDYEIEE